MGEKSRGNFASSIGFVLAAAGSAIGLGNIWKFPYLAGSNGGGLFLIIYAALIIVVGIPLLIAETSIGRYGQLDAYGGYVKIATEQGSKHPKMWGVTGFFGILCVFIIHTYYIVVGGWVTAYVCKMAVNSMGSLTDSAFSAFVASPIEPLVFTAVFAVLCLIVILGGVQNGIERASKILMPALFVMLIIVCIRAVTLPGASDGLKFLFFPDVDNMNNAGGVGRVALAAMSQAFWSLSLGQGIMIAYGSYQKKDSNIVKDSVWVAILDTFVAILAGTAIMSAVFALGMKPSQGTGLLFATLPQVFNAMGPVVGKIFGVIFFLAVLVAALTSAISQLEVAVCFLVDTMHINRRKATFGAFTVALIIGCFASLSMGVLSDITFAGKNIFDGLGWIGETILIPVAAFFTTILVGWIWKPQNALLEITNEGTLPFKFAKVWSILIKFIIPIAIAYIFFSGIF